MRAVCVFKEGEHYSREVLDWLVDFKHFGGGEIQILNPDTREGEEFVKARGVLMYPYVAVVDKDGRVLFEKAGLPMPRFDEVKYWTM